MSEQPHTHADGTTHTHGDGHGHTHSHAHTKAVLNRLSRAQGHLDAVRRMVERGEDCSAVLVQLSAVISALNSTGRVILKDHIAHCIVDAVEDGDTAAIDSLNDAIDRLLSNLTQRQQTILRLHFGMEDGNCYSLEEIGKKLSISKERVRQIERQAMDKLQKMGTSLGLEDFLE